jgi:hypothetical protein
MLPYALPSNAGRPGVCEKQFEHPAPLISLQLLMALPVLPPAASFPFAKETLRHKYGRRV